MLRVLSFSFFTFTDLSKTFELEPTSMRVFMGDVAVFRCHMTGQPPPEVRWFKDGRPLTTDQTSYIQHLDGTLEIRRVHFDDFARYKCQASNADRSRDSREVTLTQNGNLSEYSLSSNCCLFCFGCLRLSWLLCMRIAPPTTWIMNVLWK